MRDPEHFNQEAGSIAEAVAQIMAGGVHPVPGDEITITRDDEPVARYRVTEELGPTGHVSLQTVDLGDDR